MLKNEGYTLVELIVVMAIFITIIIITGYTFNNIITKGGQQLKSAETNIEGIVGLEMLRSDLEHAGFGLFWAFPESITPTGPFAETVTTSDYPIKGITAYNYIDTIPRAIVVATTPAGSKIIDGTGNTNPGVAYLVIKSTRVGKTPTASKWAFVNYSAQMGASFSNKSYIKKWGTSDDFSAGERVITLATTFTNSGSPSKQLAMVDASDYSYQTTGSTPEFPPDDAYKPGDASQIYVVYGVDPSSDLKMPYNRADYYVKKPSPADENQIPFPKYCNPGTGILIKGVVQQSDRSFRNSEYPLLNCVGDMQVEFELDLNNDGNISYSPNLPATAAQIRSQLKAVHVYILAHEGKKDRYYTYPKDSIQVGDPVRPSSSGRTLQTSDMTSMFGSDWKNYRWKVYTIVIQPKNLD